MTHSHNSDHLIIQTKQLVESNKQSEIRLNANGGNSILIVCEPKQELDYINSIKSQMDTDNYLIIDLNELLSNFIASNTNLIEELFDLLKGSVPQIFKSNDNSDEPDLFKLIISVISESFKQNKIPVLIHTGALYGSGIDNIHLMEHEVVMKSNIPLIILYPATKDGDKLLFLSKRPASKYRCMIINDQNS